MLKKINKLRLLFKYLRDPEMSGFSKFLFFLPIFYFISPVDIFPDIIFPFGYIEDFGVLLFGWSMIVKELDKYWRQKQVEKGEAAGKKGNVIDLDRSRFKVK